MKLHRSSTKLLSIALGALAVVGGSWMAGCGTSGVGSSPSTTTEVSEFLSKHPESEQIKGGRPGTNFQGLKSIKSKIFAAKAEEKAQ